MFLANICFTSNRPEFCQGVSDLIGGKRLRNRLKMSDLAAFYTDADAYDVYYEFAEDDDFEDN